MHSDNLRILIVEDDYETARLFSRLLSQKFSAEIEKADSCFQARERFSSQEYDLITLDHQLPDGEGLDLLKEITAKADHPPIVMITGHGDERTAVEAFKAGVSGYVVKDNRLSVILPETVRQVLSEVALKQAEEEVKLQRDNAQHYLDIAEVILLALDRKGTVTLVNRKGCEVLGYSEEEIVDRNWFDNFVPETTKDGLRQAFEKMLPRHDIAEYYEAEVLTKQGATRTIAWRNSLLMDNQGRAVGTLGSGNDITDKKIAEQSLKESEETFRIAAETATDLIYIWNLSSDKLEWFGDIDGALDYGPGEFPRTINGWLDAIHPDDYVRVVDALDRLVLTGEPFKEEFRVRKKDGSYRYWINRSRALTNEAGVSVKIIGATLDIVNLKRVEEDLYESSRDLQAFAQVASHDLKGPLSSILAGARLLEDLIDDPGENEAELKEVARTMAVSSVKAYDLTGKILELAGSGLIPEKITDVETKVVIDRVLDEWKTEIDRKGVQVIAEIGIGSIKANETQVYQLFSNLIGNAVSFNSSREPVVEIIERNGRHGFKYEYIVRDNGPGIPDDLIDDILKPFKKGRGGGTGLGLSIVDRIVRAHGGKISVFNNGGANFKFSLNDFPEELLSSEEND